MTCFLERNKREICKYVKNLHRQSNAATFETKQCCGPGSHRLNGALLRNLLYRKKKKKKSTHWTAGLSPSFILSLIWPLLRTGEVPGVCPFTISLGMGVWLSSTPRSRSRSFSFFFFFSRRLWSSLLLLSLSWEKQAKIKEIVSKLTSSWIGDF